MTRAKAEKIKKGIDDKIRKATVDMEWWANFWGFTVDEYEEFLDMAIKALQQAPKRRNWIPVSWHEITEAERVENGYPKDWNVFIDCEMPADGEEILITTRYGTVEKDVCCKDGEFSLDSGYDWIDDVVAWTPLPKPYERQDEK